MESLCNRYEEMMFNFIDGELTEAQADEFNKHIIGCELCRAELERRKKTVKLIAESAYEPESSLAAAVTGSITQLKKSRKRFGWSSTIAACVVAIVILSNFIFMDMYRKNINKSDNMSASENTEMVYSKAYSDNGITSDIPQTTESAPNAARVYGIIAGKKEAETSADMTDTVAADQVLPEAAAPPIKPDTGSAADMINYNTQLYAPDYTGKVSIVIISYEKAASDAKLLKDADNYSVYIIDYSPEKSQLLQQTATEAGSTLYSAEPSEDTPYILYVYLKKA